MFKEFTRRARDAAKAVPAADGSGGLGTLAPDQCVLPIVGSLQTSAPWLFGAGGNRFTGKSYGMATWDLCARGDEVFHADAALLTDAQDLFFDVVLPLGMAMEAVRDAARDVLLPARLGRDVVKMIKDAAFTKRGDSVLRHALSPALEGREAMEFLEQSVFAGLERYAPLDRSTERENPRKLATLMALGEPGTYVGQRGRAFEAVCLLFGAYVLNYLPRLRRLPDSDVAAVDRIEEQVREFAPGAQELADELAGVQREKDAWRDRHGPKAEDRTLLRWAWTHRRRAWKSHEVIERETPEDVVGQRDEDEALVGDEEMDGAPGEDSVVAAPEAGEGRTALAASFAEAAVAVGVTRERFLDEARAVAERLGDTPVHRAAAFVLDRAHDFRADDDWLRFCERVVAGEAEHRRDWSDLDPEEVAWVAGQALKLGVLSAELALAGVTLTEASGSETDEQERLGR